jgi:hypothetical protein
MGGVVERVGSSFQAAASVRPRKPVRCIRFSRSRLAVDACSLIRSSRVKFVGNLSRAVSLDNRFRLGIVHALEQRPFAQPLAAHEDGD